MKHMKLLSDLNRNFDAFLRNTDFMVASILGLILLITFKEQIAREMTNLWVFLLVAIIVQLMMHDVLISGLAALLVTAIYNVSQQKQGVVENFKNEDKKLKAIVEKLEADSEKIMENVDADDIAELDMDGEIGDDETEAAKKRRENLKVDRMSPSEAQRELFKLVDVGAQLQKQMEQMVPSLKKAGGVMKMLKGMKNV